MRSYLRTVFVLVTLCAAAIVAVFAWLRGARTRPRTLARRPPVAHAAAATLTAPLRPREQPPAALPPRMFRMDARHSGRSGYGLPRHPRVRGRIETGGRISAQPVVSADGRVLFGSHDGMIYAADPAEGRVIWRFATGDRVYATPLVAADGHVYVGSDADRFFSLTSAGGLEVALGTDDDADTSAVLAPDGTLRFAAGRMLYSVDADLTVRWRLEFGGKVFSSPALLEDGTAIVGCQDDSVYAVDAAGAVRWRFSTGGDVDAPPAVDNAGVVYIGSDDGSLYALSAADGSLRWRRALGGYVRAAAALGLDGTVVVGTYGPRPRVVGLDRASGELRWSVPVPGPPTADFGIASAALVDREGRYALGTPSDSVLILSPEGRIEARVTMPADVDSAPVLIAEGLLAVGCDDGALYLLGD